jgi:alanyl-tRNA synthetase
MVIILGMYFYFNQKVEEFHCESADLIRRFTATYHETMSPLAKEARIHFEEIEKDMKTHTEHCSFMRQSMMEDLKTLAKDIDDLKNRYMYMVQERYAAQYEEDKGNIKVVRSEVNKKKDMRKRNESRSATKETD